jgi:hypothetical protein
MAPREIVPSSVSRNSSILPDQGCHVDRVCHVAHHVAHRAPPSIVGPGTLLDGRSGRCAEIGAS